MFPVTASTFCLFMNSWRLMKVVYFPNLDAFRSALWEPATAQNLRGKNHPSAIAAFSANGFCHAIVHVVASAGMWQRSVNVIFDASLTGFSKECQCRSCPPAQRCRCLGSVTNLEHLSLHLAIVVLKWVEPLQHGLVDFFGRCFFSLATSGRPNECFRAQNRRMIQQKRDGSLHLNTEYSRFCNTKTLRGRLLSWHCTLRSQEAVLHQQTLRLLLRL